MNGLTADRHKAARRPMPLPIELLTDDLINHATDQQQDQNSENQHQSEIASSPGTIGRVRGRTPRYASTPMKARMPVNTTSLIASAHTARGRVTQSRPAIG